MLTLDQLTDIIAKGEQLEVEFKSDRLVYALYGLTDEEIVGGETVGGMTHFVVIQCYNCL